MHTVITRLLNNVSMYRLVSIALTLLWAVSIILSFTGILTYQPPAFVASIAVLIASTYLASLLFGLLFGVRVHSESSYITAFILFFIFTPTLELPGLVALGLTGSIAAASKFILAVRGRHVFNPAAAAAFIIGLTGLGFASWWVATPPLLPVTLFFAALILYKTRRLLIGVVFILLASTLIVGNMLSFGTDFTQSISLLASWPLLFFAGFMLSEPLTLPRRRWQQIVEAIVIALLFAIPIHIGNIATNPAIALLAGNLLAFIFSRRRAITLTLKGSKEITPSAREFIFSSPDKVSFEPGQYIEVALPHKKKDMRGIRRVFSITSAPQDSEIRFAVKFYNPSSTFKRQLNALSKGAVISATGTNGDFTLPNDPATPLLYVAGGIGITPFISHLRHLQRSGETRNIVLVYAVSSDKDIAYADVLATSGITIYIVAQKRNAPPANDWHYIHAPRITKQLLEEIIPDIADRHAFISGPPALVDSVKRMTKQMHAKKITTDYFIGY